MMAIALPLSMFLMSVSTILLAANWIIWGDYKRKFQLFISNKAAWIFSLIYLMHIIGGLYSTDMDFFMDDLRIKLPLLVYPLVLGSTPPLARKQTTTLMWAFTAALVLSSLVSLFIYLGYTSRPVNNFRDISPFISHIRLSLLTCVAITWLFLSLIATNKIACRLLCLAAIVWLVKLLDLLQSATGFALLAVLLVAFLISKVALINNKLLKWSAIALFIALPPAYIGFQAWKHFTFKDKVEVKSLDKYSASGNPYLHQLDMKITENGHRVFIYTIYTEIEAEWPKRSNVSLDSIAPNGSNIEAALIRYLTSKNLRKDSAGVWALSNADIKAIEQGIGNCNYKDSGLQKRLYGLFQEIDSYRAGLVNGNSATQRIEYVKTAYHIIKNNFWFGVGTGDLKLAFDKQYAADNTPLEPQFRLRAHNQYLSIWVGFGLIGLMLFLVCIVLPCYHNNTYKSKVFIGFFLVALISFLSEDTLETQAGASFFIFFYGLFVWASRKKID